LSPPPDTARAIVTWDHDPLNPVRSSVSPDDFWNFLLCWPDERALGERPDVITFTSEPLTHNLDIVGHGLVRFGAATTGPSLHIFAKLLDVHPDGVARPIAHGRIVLFEPDLDECYQLDLDTQAYRVWPGHRLRLHLTSSDNPLYLIHPGTDDNPWFAVKYEVNRQSLAVGGPEPAFLELPVLEGR
jgi:putative CocE/NonD family hydrolase